MMDGLDGDKQACCLLAEAIEQDMKCFHFAQEKTAKTSV